MSFDTHSIVLSVVRVHFFFAFLLFDILPYLPPLLSFPYLPKGPRPPDGPVTSRSSLCTEKVLRPTRRTHTTAQCVVYIVEHIVEDIVPHGGLPSHSTPPVTTTGNPGHLSKRSQMYSPEDKLKSLRVETRSTVSCDPQRKSMWCATPSDMGVLGVP